MSDWKPSEAEGLAHVLRAAGTRDSASTAVKILDSSWLDSYVARRTVKSADETKALHAGIVAVLVDEGWCCDPSGHDRPPPTGLCSDCDQLRSSTATAILGKVFGR